MDSSHIPTPPRKPSKTAHDLIFRYRGNQKIYLILGAIFAPVGLLALVLNVWHVLSEFTTWSAPLTAQATPIKVEQEKRSKEMHYYVSYQYSINGSSYSGKSESSKMEAETAENKFPVTIQVSSSDLSLSRFESQSGWALQVLFALVFGVGFGTAGLWALNAGIRSNQAEIKAFTYGVPTRAQIIEAKYDKSIKINGDYPFVITWAFTVNEKSYTGSLTSMEKAELDPFTQAADLFALYLPEDPSKNTLYIA